MSIFTCFLADAGVPRTTGISKEACENAHGRWFRTPCVTLKECIEDRPTNDTEAFSPSYEKFAQALEIQDPANKTQCQAAREELGFDHDHPHDTDICKKLTEFKCVRINLPPS